MPIDSFNCWEDLATTEVPPPHLWICCGFGDLPFSVSGTFTLENTVDTPPECLTTWGTGSHSFTLTREPCSGLYEAAGIPFYVGAPDPALCVGSPYAANTHINSWGLGPGPVSYTSGNCIKDHTTGAITFGFCGIHVGNPLACLFSVCVTGAG